jgi:hypothetical protein
MGLSSGPKGAIVRENRDQRRVFKSKTVSGSVLHKRQAKASVKFGPMLATIALASSRNRRLQCVLITQPMNDGQAKPETIAAPAWLAP